MDNTAMMNASDVEKVLRELQEMSRINKLIQETTNNIGFKFMVTFVVLGALAVCLNIAVLTVILIHRRRTMKQVFYILVTSFAINDIFRGICLVLWSVRVLKPESDQSSNERKDYIVFKIDQIAIVVLRSCTLCNIFNLLMITLNEFIFIQFPLKYCRIVKVSRAIVAVICSWIFSIFFALVATYARNYSRNIHSIFIISNNSTRSTDGDVSNLKFRREKDGGEVVIQHAFNFVLLGICFVCFCVVVICYIMFFLVVRKFQRQEEDLMRSHQLPRRTSSEASIRGGNVIDSTVSIDNSMDESRKFKTQILRRYKHALVIGLVILVYTIYLLPYAAIQLIQYSVLPSAGSNTFQDADNFQNKLIQRMLMQLLFGVHALLQPLCYFRMREFRKLFVKTFTQHCPSYTRSRGAPLSSYAETYAAVCSTTPTARRASECSTLFLQNTNATPNGILSSRTSKEGILVKRPSGATLDGKKYQQVSFADTPRPLIKEFSSNAETPLSDFSPSDQLLPPPHGFENVGKAPIRTVEEILEQEGTNL